MRGMAVTLALTPFVLLEIGLRLFAPPLAGTVDLDPLVDLHQLRPLFVLNRPEGRWEIPPERFNFFRPDSFLADKPPGSRRIFVLGGSTVQGRPYATETSFATWLRLRLQAASPETQFEVVNCGGVSYASYRVAKVLDEILDHQPDAIVIYTGHNEFLEDREYAEVRDMGAVRQWLARIAASLRTVTWIRNKLSRPTPPPNPMSGEVDARLDHVGGLDKYRRDPIWRSGVERHFAETLDRMVTAAELAGVPTILCVPAGDLVNTPPFKVARANRWHRGKPTALRDAWAIAQNSEAGIDERLAACEAYLAIDPEHAGANYLAGRLHAQRGDNAAAIRYLTAARDHDVCPLRATTPIIQAVRETASDRNVPLIDSIANLDQRDLQGRRIADGIADPEFFVDHVHPTIAGHQVLGHKIALQIGKLGWFSADAAADARYEALAVQHAEQLGEAYYARGQQRLEGLRRWAAGRAAKLVPARTGE